MNRLQVVYDDMLQASKTFRTEAQAYSSACPVFGIPVVPDQNLLEAINTVVDGVRLTYDMISKSIDGHGIKMQRAHDVYQNSEIDSTQLCQALGDPDAIQ